ncbi:MAG: hypothetical protein K5770_06100 [Lachnospiraceae bacterium]|nr:hypothetical protein [Lachnospiraceae bacterium]
MQQQNDDFLDKTVSVRQARPSAGPGGSVFCRFCGAENEEGSVFCFSCGKQIGAKAERTEKAADNTKNADSADDIHDIDDLDVIEDLDNTENISRAENAERREPKEPKEPRQPAKTIRKRSLKPGYFKLAAVVIIAAVIVCVFRMCGNSGSGSDTENVAVSAFIDYEDTALLPLMNGKIVEIDDTQTALLSPDRKKIVVLDITGELYFTDTSLGSKTPIEDDTEDVQLLSVTDDHVLYGKEDGTYLYAFSGKESVRLSNGRIEERIEKKGNLLYKNDGAIYLYTKASKEKEKIGSCEEDCKLLYLSDDAKKAYWVQKDSSEEDKYEVYSYLNGERNKMCSYTAPYAPGLVMNAGETYGILGTSRAESLYVIDNKEEAMKVGMGNPIIFFTNALFTRQGFLREDRASSFSGMYVIVESNDNEKYNLYYIDKKGEREKMISGLSDLFIQNGWLYYREDDELSCARIEGDSLKNEKNITHDVDYLLLANGGYVYFLKDGHESDNGDQYGTIYVVKDGRDPVKICDDALINDIYSSPDGKTLYYFRDPDNDPKSGYISAAFYKYTYGKKNPEKISDSVCCYEIFDGTENDQHNDNKLNDRFIYYKKIDYNDFQWMYYNGKDSEIMASELDLSPQKVSADEAPAAE